MKIIQALVRLTMIRMIPVVCKKVVQGKTASSGVIKKSQWNEILDPWQLHIWIALYVSCSIWHLLLMLDFFCSDHWNNAKNRILRRPETPHPCRNQHNSQRNTQMRQQSL